MRILIGVKVDTGTWETTVDNLNVVGHPTEGAVTINT